MQEIYSIANEKLTYIDTVFFPNLKDVKVRWDELIEHIKSQLRNSDGTYHNKFTIIEENYDEKDYKKCRFKFSYIKKSGIYPDSNTEEYKPEELDEIKEETFYIYKRILCSNIDEYNNWIEVEVKE